MCSSKWVTIPLRTRITPSGLWLSSHEAESTKLCKQLWTKTCNHISPCNTHMFEVVLYGKTKLFLKPFLQLFCTVQHALMTYFHNLCGCLNLNTQCKHTMQLIFCVVFLTRCKIQIDCKCFFFVYFFQHLFSMTHQHQEYCYKRMCYVCYKSVSNKDI